MQPRVRIEPFGDTLDVAPGETVLATLLRHGRFVQYGCKHGGCGTCRAELVSGDCELSSATSFALSDADREAGIVLLCATRVAGGEAVLDLSRTMTLDEEAYRAGRAVTEHQAEIVEIAAPAPALRLVRLRLPEAMRFSAGQYVEVEVPGGRDEWRTYSMASPPGEPLELLVKLVPGGRFSEAIAGPARPGDRLRVRGPLGQFGVRLSHRPMVMVAGGAGVGPLRAMLHELARDGNRRPVTLLHAGDLAFREELEALAARHGWLTYLPHPRPGNVLDGLARALPDARGHEAYLCGPPGLVDAARRALIAAGCKERHVFFDRFVPSG